MTTESVTADVTMGGSDGGAIDSNSSNYLCSSTASSLYLQILRNGMNGRIQVTYINSWLCICNGMVWRWRRSQIFLKSDHYFLVSVDILSVRLVSYLFAWCRARFGIHMNVNTLWLIHATLKMQTTCASNSHKWSADTFDTVKVFCSTFISPFVGLILCLWASWLSVCRRTWRMAWNSTHFTAFVFIIFLAKPRYCPTPWPDLAWHCRPPGDGVAI